MHTVWWERNARRHGEDPKTMATLTQLVDKKYKTKATCTEREGKLLRRRADYLV